MENKTNFIDFDYASICWRQNKKYKGNGYFIYKCNHISKKTGMYCKNNRYLDLFCKYHYKKENNNK